MVLHHSILYYYVGKALPEEECLSCGSAPEEAFCLHWSVFQRKWNSKL